MMQFNSVLRVGMAGAIGIGLFLSVGAGAKATDPPETALRIDAPPSSPAESAGRPTNADTPDRPPVLRDFPPQITPWHRYTVASGDSLSKLFARADLPAAELVTVLNLGHGVAALKQLHPGDVVEIRKTPSGQLSGLRYKLDPIRTLAVDRSHGELAAKVLKLDSETRRLSATGTVGRSLSGALSAAGVPARVATQLAHIYRYRSPLSRHMHSGDRFRILYQAQFANGERVAVGPILAARITRGGHTLEAFRAVDGDGNPAYYDASGRPYRPSISRHPVDYTRISSPFDRHRMHPILHIRRPHLGVDMAAARGTPIHAAAEGTVKFVGRKHGYGRLVELRHFQGYSTRYGHMFKFAKNLHDGEHVDQGQLIGYVGATGEATGPHLHFEIRKDGRAHDPLAMPLPNGQPLTGKKLASFSNRIQPLIAKLEHTPGQPKTLIAANATILQQGDCARAGAVNAALVLAPDTAADGHALSQLFCVVAANGST